MSITKIKRDRLLGGLVVFLFGIFFVLPILKPDNHQGVIQEKTKDLFEPKSKQIAQKQPKPSVSTQKNNKIKEKQVPKTKVKETPKGLVLESTISLESLGDSKPSDQPPKKGKKLAIGDFAERSAAQVVYQLFTTKNIPVEITTVDKSDGEYFRILLPFSHAKDKKLIEKIAKKENYQILMEVNNDK